MATDIKTTFNATASSIAVLAGNPGLSFSAAQLGRISAGTLVLRPTVKRCITHLRYQDGDRDLQQVTFDDGSWITSTQITNLGDFRRRFQEAANFGHGVTFCEDKEDKRMFMLNIYPCECQCEDKG